MRIHYVKLLTAGVGFLLAVSTSDSRQLRETNAQPSVLTCTSNAKAVRDYGFAEKTWGGGGGANSGTTFAIGTKGSLNGQILRDKVFAGLSTARPTVRSITPSYSLGAGINIEEDAAEFPATVLSRAFDSVWISWKNPPQNKVWTAVINLKERKAVVTQLFEGATSVGGEVETLDCR